MSTGLDAHVVVSRENFTLDVALTVAPAEVLGVLGPNGAGKSTLLRVLAGLLPLTAGHVHLDEQVLDDVASDVFVPADQRRIGLVFQDYRLFPHLRVVDNVGFSARSRGASKRLSRDLAHAVLEQSGLSHLAMRRPGELSGGQAQRVALARALASNPRLLLFDEPLAALDARSRLEVRAALRRQSFAGPTVLVSHDPLDALVLADRLLVLEDGAVVQQGATAEVARRPATPYVARLVGLNLYAGTLGARGVDLDGGGRLVTTSGHHPGGTPLLLAISPSAIWLHTTEPTPGSARNVWQGTVVGVEMLTERVRVQVEGAPSALVDVTPAAVAELRLGPGTPVWLSVKATEIEAYPRE